MSEADFLLRVHVEYKDETISTQTQMRNSGVPEEFAITKVRAWLRQAENKYFDDFDKGSVVG